MVFRFLVAMWTFLTGSNPLLPEFLIHMRAMTCRECEEYRVGVFRNYCNKCGCTLSLGRSPFNKLAHPCEECPLGKWTKVGHCD